MSIVIADTFSLVITHTHTHTHVHVIAVAVVTFFYTCNEHAVECDICASVR